MEIGKPGLRVPGVELRLDLAEVLLRRRVVADIEASIAQRETEVGRDDEAVPADPAQEILAGIAAQAAAVLAEIGHQADLVVGRPAGQETAEAAMLGRYAVDEGRALAHRLDLLGIADDALVGSEVMPVVVGLEEQPLRLETEERFFEVGPFLLDDAPDEAGRKDAAGHRREDAVVGHVGEQRIVGRRGQQRGEDGLTALALGGARPDRVEALHRGSSPRSIGRGKARQQAGFGPAQGSSA